jgi:hypothetical protein
MCSDCEVSGSESDMRPVGTVKDVERANRQECEDAEMENWKG